MKEKEEDQIPKIDPAEIEILIGKFEQNKLGEEEKRLIVRMLRTLLMVVASLQEKKITLQRLRDMFFGRRKFWEIANIYPTQCGYVLMRIGEIYEYEGVTKDKGMSDDERLSYHQKHSQPLMEELREWIEREINEKRVEPNSSLGKAISYFQKHYPELCGFIKYAGAPLDNKKTTLAI